jgi:hypothetical protein
MRHVTVWAFINACIDGINYLLILCRWADSSQIKCSDGLAKRYQVNRIEELRIERSLVQNLCFSTT